MSGRCYRAESERDELARKAGFDTVVLNDPNGRVLSVYTPLGQGRQAKDVLDRLLAESEQRDDLLKVCEELMRHAEAMYAIARGPMNVEPPDWHDLGRRCLAARAVIAKARGN